MVSDGKSLKECVERTSVRNKAGFQGSMGSRMKGVIKP